MYGIDKIKLILNSACSYFITVEIVYISFFYSLSSFRSRKTIFPVKSRPVDRTNSGTQWLVYTPRSFY